MVTDTSLQEVCLGELSVPGGHNGMSECYLLAAESCGLCMGIRTAASRLEFNLLIIGDVQVLNYHHTAASMWSLSTRFPHLPLNFLHTQC